jgi:uncharacterized protein
VTAQPIASNLFETSGSSVHLIGGRRKSDGRIVFPMPSGAAAAQYESVKLGSQGTLWSYTVQRFRPKSPPYGGAEDERAFKPFALGYVELPGQVIVETRIDVDDPAKLKIGMKMLAGTQEFARADGGQALTYVFRPAA